MPATRTKKKIKPKKGVTKEKEELPEIQYKSIR